MSKPVSDGPKRPELPKDIDRIIRKAMELTDKGKTVDEIAVACGIESELAERICRMYVTHPGVDVSGIMMRIT